MPNPTSKILAEWAEGCSEETKAWLEREIAQGFPADATPLDVLVSLDRRVGPKLIADFVRLRLLILRWLEGAGRMKAKAEEIANQPPPQQGQRSGKVLHTARQIVAREILEALDG